MSTQRDKFTTLVGAIGGASLIFKAFGVINQEQHLAIAQSAPFFLSGAAIIINSYHIGKKE